MQAKPERRGPQLRLVGKPQCRHIQSGQWRDLPVKAAALLALLAVERAVSRAAIATYLWPDAAGDKPRNNLRGLLRDLRVLTGGELFGGTDTLELAAGVAHDLTALAGAAVNTLQVSDLPEGRLLGAYDYAELDAFDEWLEGARERWRAAGRQALCDLATRHEQAGQWAPAIALAERLIAEEPVDEAAYRRLMRVRYRSGDRQAALDAYTRCRAALDRVLAAEPSQETRALATLCELHEPLPEATLVRPASARLVPAELVARDAELAAVRHAWAAGQAVLLEGEAGIGKTRLWAALAAAHAGAVHVGALAGEAEVPYAALARVLRALLQRARVPLAPVAREELARLLPELGAAATRPALTAQLVAALVAALEAWRTAGVDTLLLDDLHWADHASVSLLLAAMARAPGWRWGLAARPAQRPAALEAALQAAPERWHLVQAAPLDAHGVEGLLRAMPLPLVDAGAWGATLAQRTLGSPLLVVETVLALRHRFGDGIFRAPPEAGLPLPVPAQLQHLLQARLERLPTAALHLAQLAALSGPVFAAGLALQVLGVNELALGSAWATLESELVLQGDGLAHETLREPLLAMLPAAVAQALHGRVAEVAATLDAPAAEVAQHWWSAQAWGRAASGFERAAAQAFALSARFEEMRLWQRAADCHDRLGQMAMVFAARHRACDAATTVLPADQVSDQVAWLIAAAQSVPQRIDAALIQARHELTLTHFDLALEAGQRAVDLCSTLPGDPRRARATVARSAALAALGHRNEAIEALGDMATELASSDDLRLQLDVYGMAGYANAFANRADAAIAAYTRAVALAEALDDASEGMTLASNLAGLLVLQGDDRRALETMHQAEAWRARLDEAGSVAAGSSLMNLGVCCRRLGRHGEALRALEAARALLEEAAAPRWVLACENHIALTWLALGSAARARAALRPWPADLTDRRVARALCEAAIARHEGRSVAPFLRDARVHAAAESATMRMTLELAALPEIAPVEAIALCRALAEQAAAGNQRSVEQGAWLGEAESLRRAGKASEAVPRLRAVLARLTDCLPVNLSLAEVWWTAFEVFDAAGQQADAEDALRRGRAWILGDALPHVPIEWRTSFLRDNAANRRLLEAATHVPE